MKRSISHRTVPYCLIAIIGLVHCHRNTGFVPPDRTSIPKQQEKTKTDTDGYSAVMDAAEASRSLQSVLDQLVHETAWRSPSTEIAIAVHDVTTGETASINGNVLHVSASAVKPIWVAAALNDLSVDFSQIKDLARPIFESSDNDASGAAIDLVGIDGVNLFMWNVLGMNNSALTNWSYGGTRRSELSPRKMGADNYVTANDAIRFLTWLESGETLSSERSNALKEWMTWSPRNTSDGLGGWLGERLPASAQASMMHKAGWLPPGCCDDDTVYNSLNEIGVIRTKNGHVYAIAILTRRGHEYWTKQVALVEYASCAVYKHLANDASLDCSRASDPENASACGDVDYLGYCDGSVVVWCDNNVLRSKNCAPQHKTCAWQDDSVGFNCLATQTCASAEFNRCAGWSEWQGPLTSINEAASACPDATAFYRYVEETESWLHYAPNIPAYANDSFTVDCGEPIYVL